MARHHYVVVYELNGSTYRAYAPDLPGCEATGKTLNELTRNMQSAMRQRLVSLEQQGQPLPETLSKNFFTVTTLEITI